MTAQPGLGPLRSPNIWDHPDTYELENEAFDPDGIVAQALRDLAPWQGRTVLDIGCGAGYHLPIFAAEARRVIGVEPHLALAGRAERRMARLRRACRAGAEPNATSAPGTTSAGGVVAVVAGLAQALPLADASIDVAHARWAYFFGPGCEPGLAELDRVLRPGGTAVVIDNDASASTFGRWFRREHPAYDPDGVARFWRRHGWSRLPVTTRWQMASRDDFAAVARIEFSPALAEAILAEHTGAGVDYAVNLWWRRAGR